MKHTCGFQTGYLVCPACNAGLAFEKSNVTFAKEEPKPYYDGIAYLDALGAKEFDRTSSERDPDLVGYWSGKGFPENFKFLDFAFPTEPEDLTKSLKLLFAGYGDTTMNRIDKLVLGTISPKTVLCPCGCGGQISEEQARSIRNAATEPKEIDRLRKLLAEERERADRAEDELSALKRQLRMR